jgi:hypothetical protein
MIEKIFYEIDEDFWCETRYINNIIDYLKDKLDNVSIVVTPNLHSLPPTKFKKIVILTGDELGRISANPYKNQDVLAVFRIFNVKGRYDNRYVFPIPPGYNWTMHNDSTKKMVRMYPEKKLSERKYDIFFSGQPLPWRVDVFNSLNKLSGKFNVLSSVNKSFRTGLHIDEYYKILGETKIALSPDGTSIDCFRYVEALGSGCIVITTNKDTDIWYYKDTPAFFINSWNELNEDLINRILSMDLDDLYTKNLNYYNERLSEEAVAKYILDNIKVML